MLHLSFRTYMTGKMLILKQQFRVIQLHNNLYVFKLATIIIPLSMGNDTCAQWQ